MLILKKESQLMNPIFLKNISFLTSTLGPARPKGGGWGVLLACILLLDTSCSIQKRIAKEAKQDI